MKRKKYPALPNGYGSIRFLGKNRKNCFAVHPPATDRDDRGNYIRPSALCYVDDWYVGFAVLNAYHAGTYKPGDELTFKAYRALSESDLDAFCNRLLADYTAHTHVEETRKETEKTFAQVYDEFFEWKYGEKASKKLSQQSRSSTRAAFKNCSSLHDKVFRDIRLEDMQSCLDSCTLKQASIENMKTLLGQMYKYAVPRDICTTNYAQYLRMPDAEEDEHGVPFTEEDIEKLWKNKEHPTVEMLLIMIYSGYRITAYKTMKVDMKEWYFQGGVKTAAGKNRIVPIHSAIRPLVNARIERKGALLSCTTCTFRKSMYEALEALGIERHTPHDCRTTFSTLCRRYGVATDDRERMMGHSLNLGDGVYTRRTVEELRAEIEKIKVPELVTTL